MSKINFGVDIDDCLYDFVGMVLDAYNEAYDDDVQFDDITDFNIHQFLKPECKNVFKEFCNKQFFKDVTFSQTVIDSLTRLNEKTNLYFVTSTHPKCVRAKDKMLSRNLPWYSSKQLIVCRNKQLLNLDYLVDDNPDNLEGGKYRGILLHKPWNKKYANCPSCHYACSLEHFYFNEGLINYLLDKLETTYYAPDGTRYCYNPYTEAT